MGTFNEAGIAAEVIGELTADSRIVIRRGEEEAVLFDWKDEAMVVGKRDER